MTSPNAVKLIKSLREKKYRQETKKFLVEGTKSVMELIASDYPVESVYATKDFIANNQKLLDKKNIKAQAVDSAELKAFGTLEHNDGALAIAHQKVSILPSKIEGIVLALDDIRDPGNLGTLIRIADWYGITDIICSGTCVDWYNPKVVASSMGSFTRVRGHYTDLPSYLKKQDAPVLGAFLGGTSVHTYAFPKNGILVIGSESHGISAQVEKLTTEKITIPRFGEAESLNAAIAGAIILDRWKSAK